MWDRPRTLFILGLIIPQEVHLSTLSSVLGIMAFSSLAGRKRHCSQPCVSSGALFPLNVSFRSFLGTWRFLVHIHWSVLISTTHYSRGSVFSYTCTDQYIKYWVLKGNPGDSREISLESYVFFFIFLYSAPWTLTCLIFLDSWMLSELVDSSGLNLVFFSCTAPLKLKTVNQDSKNRAHLVCFCPTGIISPFFLPVVLCLKNSCYIYIYI